MKNLLPAGSVVLLKNATKKVMIIGVLQIKADEHKMYDYLAVPYPEGYLGDGKNFLFNHEDILDVVFQGYSNPEHQAFLKLMEAVYDKVQQGKARAETDTQQP